MKSRAVFIDVDGTLVNDRGLVPSSARSSIQQARANGHRVFLCTGRAISQLWPEILAIGFDGIVASAGGYVATRDAVLAHHRIPTEHLRHVTAFFDSHAVQYLLESHDGVFGSAGIRDLLEQRLLGSSDDPDLRAQRQRGLGGFIDTVIVGADPADLQVIKVSFLDSPVELRAIRDEFRGVFDVVPTPVAAFGTSSGELSLAGVHKAAGIEVMTTHLGIDRSDTIAIGDGFNDLEMLRHAGVGIAMGDAPQPVLDAADAVTGTPDDDGIHMALVRLGLL